jgi:anthranilate synthase component I
MKDETSRFTRGGDGRPPRLVPVIRDIPAGGETPVTTYLKVAHKPWSFLFESVEGGRRWGRYSMIGCDPFLLFEARGHHAVITSRDERREEGRPLEALRAILAGHRMPPSAGMPRFSGGLVGHLGYEATTLFEPAVAARPSPDGLADVTLFAPGTILAFDNARDRLRVTVLADSREGRVGLARARGRLDEVLEMLAAPLDETPTRVVPVPVLRPSVSPGRFRGMVQTAREAVLNGEAVQVVLSQAFSAETAVDPFTVYRALRRVSPSPYLFHLALGQGTLVGASPEVMVRVEHGRALLRPLAGTRPRGATPALDRALETDLAADEKERAEHLMLLDLGRNDLGRVAAPGSVEVEDPFTVERYSHVMHLTSTISARLRPGTEALDVLAACFPAGTVSGAPKVRAMQLIAELESERRGPYAGAVGYLGFDGALDTCIAIRSMLFSNGRVQLRAGAGIVADSDREREYQETLHKSAPLRRALALAAAGEAAIADAAVTAIDPSPPLPLEVTR